jgi:hypothetical protein
MVQMRNMLMLSAAVSVLVLATSAHHVMALSGDKPVSLERLVQKVQKTDEKGPGGGSMNQGSGASQNMNQGSGASQNKGGDQGATQGTQMRSGEKGARSGQQRSNVEVNVDRGRRDRADRRRTTVGVDVDRRRRSGGGDVGVGVRGYGYSPADCQDLLRRYRQCRAR